MSGKSLDEFIQPKTYRLRWKNLPELFNPVFTIMLKLFNNSTNCFSKILRKKFARFREKIIQLFISFQAKKSPWKNYSRQIERNFDNRLKLCCQSMTKSAQILEKNRKQIFDRRKISSIFSSGHRDTFLINIRKNEEKLKLCLLFEKLYLSEKFLEIHVFPQKVPLEALSHVLIILLTIFAKSLFFPQIFFKKFKPPRPPF